MGLEMVARCDGNGMLQTAHQPVHCARSQSCRRGSSKLTRNPLRTVPKLSAPSFDIFAANCKLLHRLDTQGLRPSRGCCSMHGCTILDTNGLTAVNRGRAGLPRCVEGCGGYIAHIDELWCSSLTIGVCLDGFSPSTFVTRRKRLCL